MPAPYAGRSCALSGTRAPRGPPAGSLPDMEFSGAVATAYAEHRRGYPPPVVDLLVGALGLPRDASVLDLGCGTGQLTVPLAGRYARVIGADPSPDMLALARSRAGGAPVAWLLADDRDVTRLPLLADLDAVTIAQAIHLLDRMPLFEALADLMSLSCPNRDRRERKPAVAARPAVVPGAQRDTSGRGWAPRPAQPAARTRRAASATGPSWPPPAFRTGSEVALDYRETHTFAGIVGNVHSALSPGSLPTDPAFEAGLRDALGPGPFEEDVRVTILVTGR